jgi:hypothetical protein
MKLCIAKQTKTVFFKKNGEQEGKTCPVRGWYQWEGEDMRNGCGRVNMAEIIYIHV